MRVDASKNLIRAGGVRRLQKIGKERAEDQAGETGLEK